MATYLRGRLQQLVKHVQWSTWEGVGQCVAKASEDRVLACAINAPAQTKVSCFLSLLSLTLRVRTSQSQTSLDRMQRLPWTFVGLGVAAASVGSLVNPCESACSPAAQVEAGVRASPPVCE